jgi:cytosolic nonspecific dipeptidase
MMMMQFLCSYIDGQKATYIDTLREAVAIKSVSAWPDARPDCQRMMDWAQKKLEALGAKVEQVDIGSQTLPDGKILKLPNVIMGYLGNVSLLLHIKLCSE